MTVEADLRAVILTKCDQVFPDIAPDGSARPYVTYQEIGGEAPAFIEGALPDKKNGRFQINVWADTRAEAAALGLQIEQALVEAATFQAIPAGGRTADYEPETGLRGSRQDFSVWSDR